MSTPVAHHIAKPNATPLIRARAGMKDSPIIFIRHTMFLI